MWSQVKVDLGGQNSQFAAMLPITKLLWLLFFFIKPPPPVGASGGYMFSGCPSVRACVHPSVCDSRGSFMFPRYLQYLLTDFRQTFVTGASRDIDDSITFLGQKVKVQGHAIPAEAHSTPRYCRVQLLLVCICVRLQIVLAIVV